MFNKSSLRKQIAVEKENAELRRKLYKLKEDNAFYMKLTERRLKGMNETLLECQEQLSKVESIEERLEGINEAVLQCQEQLFPTVDIMSKDGESNMLKLELLDLFIAVCEHLNLEFVHKTESLRVRKKK